MGEVFCTVCSGGKCKKQFIHRYTLPVSDFGAGFLK